MKLTFFHGLLIVIGLALALKLSYPVFYLLYLPDSTLQDCWNLLMRFDTGWYEQIATGGYPFHPDGNLFADFFQSRYAFFPLLPLTLWAGMQLTGLNFYEWGLIWCSFLSLAAFGLLYAFAVDWLGSVRRGLGLAVLLLVFPFSYFFSVILTEGLFLLLLVGAVWSMRRQW